MLNKAWYMKYKPEMIDQIIFPNILNEKPMDPKEIKDTFLQMLNNGGIQGNVLGYGPGGFGKSSLIDVIIKQLVKSAKDIFILGKSVNDVKDLQSWLQYSKQPGSIQRVVKIEEMDKLSRDAQVMLKDGLMEKYQGKVTFLAATNHPEKIDKALKTRFNFRLNFKEIPIDDSFLFIENILKLENIEYNRDLLYKFVTDNIQIGMRDLLNAIQVSVRDNKLVSIDQIETSNNNEDYIIQVIEYLYKLFHSFDLAKMEAVLQNTSNDNNFHQYYTAVIKITKDDPFIEWDYIYKELMEKDLPLNVISIINDEYQDLDKKIFPTQHFLSTFIKGLYSIYRVSGGNGVLVKEI